jgi:hypothetical protein
MAIPRFYVQRLKINRQGYDSQGVYWGAGLPVYLVTPEAGGETLAVRARTVGQARAKAELELRRSSSLDLLRHLGYRR